MQRGSIAETADQIETLFEQSIDEMAAEGSRQRFEQACYRRLFASKVIGLCIVDRSGALLDANDYCLELAGYTRDDLAAGMRWDELIAPESRPRTEQAAAETVAYGSSAPFEVQFIHRHGHAVYGLMGVALIERSVPETAIAFVLDTTAHHRDRARLRASEERLSLALAASRQGLWDWNIVTDDTYLSPTYWDLTGYAEGEVKADRAFFLSLVHPEDRSMVEKAMQEHFRGESEVSVIEYRMRRKTGEYVWICGIGRVTQRDAGGAPVRMAGVIYDISKRKRFEDEQRFLAEAGALLSSSLDFERTLSTIATMAVGAFADWCGVDLVDESGRFTRLKVASADPSQAALCALLERLPPHPEQHHLAREVIENRRPVLLERVTRQDLEAYAQDAEHLRALLAARATSAMAVPILRQDRALGALIFASSTPSHLYGPSDVRFAEALAELAALAIENAKLYASSIRAAQLRDEVLGVVAHDLRSPLSAILMQSAFGRRAPAAARGAEPWEIVHRAASRMKRLIQDLLEVHLMEAGKLRVHPTRLDIQELLRETVEMHRLLATSSSHELRIDVQRSVPAVWGDRDRILEVLENLVGNAFKFTAPGGRITISATPHAHDVVFSVADTGRGIAPAALPHVFDRFWQATTARRSAGLGLAIAKGIVEAHGGRIWVESTSGRGTTFSFSIPRAHPETDRASAATR